MALSSINFPKELVYHIFSFLREEDLALVGMTCKIFWECVEKDPSWESSLTQVIRHMPSHANFYLDLGVKPDERALLFAIAYSPDYVHLLLEKGGLPTKDTLFSAARCSSHLIPLLLARGVDPDVGTLSAVAQFCPEHIPLITQRLHELNTTQQAIDNAISLGIRMRVYYPITGSAL